jgi:hypothetical protein
MMTRPPQGDSSRYVKNILDPTTYKEVYENDTRDRSH